MEDTIRLIRPALKLESEFRAMVEEFRAAGETRFDDEKGIKDNNFSTYIRWIQNGAKGIDLENGYVPWSSFWLLNSENYSIIGVSSVRHKLSPFLQQKAGHIGYAIRPSERKKGYGKLILSLTLEEAKQLVPDRVLVMCHSDNVGSMRIIQANGGKLQDEITDGEKSISRYWIDLS